MDTILLTGGAGFIGSHLAEQLLETGSYRLICLDNLDPFYAPELKKNNLESLIPHPNFHFVEGDLSTLSVKDLENICQGTTVTKIIHLAARAGVRPSIAAPLAYYQTNVMGMVNLLEFAHVAGVRDFIYSSSSSVYGNNPIVPWKESQLDLHPISPYAATKISGEHAGEVYAHLYPIRFTALRLFTVYGPRQRPDLAIHKFYDWMKRGEEVILYGDGTTSRDYTFVGDLVQGIRAAVAYQQPGNFEVINLGSGRPVSLLDMVGSLERAMQVRAKIRFTAEQPGDVSHTWADISKARTLLDYQPSTSLDEGVAAFVAWKEKTTTPVY